MLTLQQAYEVKASIIEYLKATFTFKDKALNSAFIDFIDGMFKGPFISLKLPFIKADPAEEIPLEIKPSFLPFYHQVQAFHRLTTEREHDPQPTILTTGTGSGKTEAFLFPMLDYCYKNRDSQGIKVIILYPMNALATDQAKRLAEAIYHDERLKGKIRAGLFIGESRDVKKTYPREMGADHIIEDRAEIVASPPDILLTNFKMLDFALMQAKYHKLWGHNFARPELLKFLVLDELHTYEGAQGSDVANLIRRLKLKLNMPDNHLCPIGTSATIGKGDESKTLLVDFATKVFGEDFDESAIIEEHRVSPDDFFGGSKLRNFVPTTYLLKGSQLKSGDEFDRYIRNQLKVWGIDPDISQLKLSDELKKYQIIRDLVEICSQETLSVDEIISKLSQRNKEFAALPKWVESDQLAPKEAVIRSILSLISYAKTGGEEKQFPFLYLQVQLWTRELSAIVRAVDDKPLFKWREDIDVQKSEKAFPAWFCRECGASGWLAVKHENRDQFENDINDVYRKFFDHHKNLYLVTPYKEDNLKIDEYEPTDIIDAFLNKYSLSLSSTAHENGFRIIAYRKLSRNYNFHICPQCNTKNTINIIGTRVSTLSSISTSQLLSTDLDPNIEKERKVLAFTNGVQDAAHQAGFIESRNYRFTFRTALQKVINLIGKPLRLSELHHEFIEYWKNSADESGKNHLKAYIYKFFPNDHTADVDIDRFKRNREEFLREFNLRIKWEISSEFGYNSIIGRTPEKTGSSATFFDQDKIEQSYHAMSNWLKENALGSVSRDDFLHFLIVFLHRLRRRGGVDHPYLNRFRNGRSSYYLITQNTNPQHFFIRNFGKNTRLPKFITDEPNRYGVFDLTTRTTSPNWFHVYFTKAFLMAPNNIDLVNDFYSQLLDVLASDEIHLFDEKSAQGIRNFALLPDQVFIQNQVSIFECDVCGDRISTTPQNDELITQSCCIVYRCPGHYRKTEAGASENYYQQVYNRGRAPRIYAADHTGLLDRQVREKIENEFKTRPEYDSKNVLVATSTLEMGIDIGTLNSAINTSVPPLPSNYLQRIGRAGRSSGSAIVINFAPNEAHDLYYFESPDEMMDGVINTPGCYLEAKEIIRRHFLAYCIDSWTKDNAETNAIPPIIRFLKLENLNVNDPDFFVNKIIAFIKKHDKNLLEEFQKSFKGKVAAEIFNQLEALLINTQLFRRIRKSFQDVKDEVLNLKQKQKEINEFAKEKGLHESDPEYLELRREYRNISALIRTIRNRQVLEHMINDGLLPNYAFPETGVTLKAQVGKRRDDDPRSYSIKRLEIVRPARSALRELVPDNIFYTQGYKLKVSGVNVVSWSEDVIDFRFCSNCDHIRRDIPPVADRCPKCGDESWRSVLNTHKVIRLKTVNSFNDERNAKLNENTTDEQRERKISTITRHFNFNPQSRQGSWVMLNIPFGIEYVKDVNIIEVNTGLQNSKVQHNTEIKINEIEVPRCGYIICRHCGKVTTSIYDEKNNPLTAEKYHYGFCKHKGQIYQLKPDDVFEEVFFYREMQTEAIKILLPVQEFNTESSIKLFKAGIIFGLKKYFRGNPDHLELVEYSEYNQQTQRKDQYLILFDVIPGGTGYLSKLFDVTEFNVILKEAYENIRDCKCKFQGKDGCYKCIYTYGNQFEREQLSRAKAEKLFEKILKSADQWDYLAGGLGKVTNSGKIEESELEERFIKVLSDFYNNAEKTEYNFSERTEDGITLYNLEINKNNASFVFEIRPQVELNPVDGVRYTTIADFLMTCMEYKIDGKSVDDVLSRFKPIAIYLDGYQYHASQENNRFITDLEKRKSIIESKKYWLWILTWNDLELFEGTAHDHSEPMNDYLKEILDHDLRQPIRQKINSHPLIKDKDTSLLKCKNNFERLIWVIDHYANDELEKSWQRFTFYFQSDYPNNCISADDAGDFIVSANKSFSDYEPAKNPDGLLYLDLMHSDEFYELRLLQKLMTLDYLGSIHIKSDRDHYEKTSWENFWILFNILQFSLDSIHWFGDTFDGGFRDSDTAEQYDEILENFDEKYHPLVKLLIDRDIDFNKDSYFTIQDNEGLIIAEAYLGLPSYHIVIDPLDEVSRKRFEENSYRVCSLENFDINEL